MYFWHKFKNSNIHAPSFQTARKRSFKYILQIYLGDNVYQIFWACFRALIAQILMALMELSNIVDGGGQGPALSFWTLNDSVFKSSEE